MTNDSAQKIKPRLVSVDLDLIDPNPYQPRTHFDAKEQEEMDASIAEYGVLQPPLGRNKPGHPGRIECGDGERRIRGARNNGHTEILFIVREFSDEQMSLMAIESNKRRADLNSIEFAQAIQRHMRDFNVIQEHAAEKFQMAPSTLSNLLRLLSLPAEVQQMHIEGKLTETHLKILCGLTEFPDDALIMARAGVTEGWSSRQLEREVATVKSNREAERQPALIEPVQPATPPAVADEEESADSEGDAPEADEEVEETDADDESAAEAGEADDDDDDAPAPNEPVSAKGIRRGDRIRYTDRMNGSSEATVLKVMNNGMLQVDRGPRENGLSVAIITEDDSVQKIEAPAPEAPAVEPEESKPAPAATTPPAAPPATPKPASSPSTASTATPKSSTPARPKAPKQTKATEVPTDKKTVAMIPGSLHTWLRDKGVVVERAVAQYKRLCEALENHGIDVDAHLTSLEEPDTESE